MSNGNGETFPLTYIEPAPNSSEAGYLHEGVGNPFSFDAAGLGFDQGTWSGGAPVDDDELDTLLQTLVAGVTGMAGEAVRPRWQPEPPNLPNFYMTWCAVGVIARRADTFVAMIHYPEGYDLLLRNEALEVLATFYGPKCHGMATRLRDGLMVDQNRELLWRNHMEMVEVGDIRSTAELIKQRWLPRADVDIHLNRQVRRTYPILNIESAHGSVTNQRGFTTSFDTTRRLPGR